MTFNRSLLQLRQQQPELPRQHHVGPILRPLVSEGVRPRARAQPRVPRGPRAVGAAHHLRYERDGREGRMLRGDERDETEREAGHYEPAGGGGVGWNDIQPRWEYDSRGREDTKSVKPKYSFGE